MTSRKIAKTKAEKLGVFKDRVSVTLMLPGRIAWGLGVLARIQGLPLGKLCEAALAELLRGQGIPWSRYDEARASLVSGTPAMEDREGLDEATLPIAEALTPSEGDPSARSSGKGSGRRRAAG
jgi:hypothetical protein